MHDATHDREARHARGREICGIVGGDVPDGHERYPGELD